MIEAMAPALARIASQIVQRQIAELAKPKFNKRLVKRMLRKWREDVPQPNFFERRRLRKALASPEHWPLLSQAGSATSEALTKVLIDSVSERREHTTRQEMAKEMAELAVTELPAALGVEEAFNLVHQNLRRIEDSLGEQRRDTVRLLQVAAEARDQRSLPDHMSADVDEYQRQLSLSLDRRMPRTIFDLTYSSSNEDVKHIDDLPDEIKATPLLAIEAPAGSGKSAALVFAARNILLQARDLIVFVDLKTWTVDAEQQTLTIDDILKSSIVKTSARSIREFHASLPGNAKLIWMIDGVNELSAMRSEQLIDVVQEHLRESIRSMLVVTDRQPTRYSEGEWTVVRINDLDRGEVERHVPLGADANGDTGRRDLLKRPFFLQIALRDGSSTWDTAVDAIHSLFVQRVGLSEEDIDATANFAFSVYDRRLGLSFDLSEMSEAIGPIIPTRLLEARVLVPVHGDNIAFYHQLLHDFLASRHIVTAQDKWGSSTFDALSFDANTYEAVFLALEQLSAEDEVARYLTALYNWNWFAAVRCVEWALRIGRTVPQHLTLLIAAMLAEKRFDAVKGSRDRADEWSFRLDRVAGTNFSRAQNLAEVVDELSSRIDRNTPVWFNEWFGLYKYVGDSSHLPNEAEIDRLADANPLIGWTTAAMIRRGSSNDTIERQIRALYKGAQNADDDVSCATRWRVVHALGNRPTRENSALLFHAIDHDSYVWVKYGAVRSLLEMAALSPQDQTAQVLSEVRARLSTLPRGPLSQVAMATQYEGAPPGWEAQVLPLLQAAYDQQTEEKERQKWRHRMAAFQSWSADRSA